MLKSDSTCFTIGPIYLYGKDETQVLENAKREIQIYNGNVDAILIKTYFNGVESLELVLSYLNELKLEIPYGINYVRTPDIIEDCKESFRLAKQYEASFVVVNSIAGYSYSVKDEGFFKKTKSIMNRTPGEKDAKLKNVEGLTPAERNKALELEKIRLHAEYEKELEEYEKTIEELKNEMREMDEKEDKKLKAELERQRKDNDIFVIGTIRDVGFFAIPGHTLGQDLTEARRRCDAILLNSGSLDCIKCDIESVRELMGSEFPIIVDSTGLPADKSFKLFRNFKPNSEKDTDELVLGANGMITCCLREPIFPSGTLLEDKVKDFKTKTMKMKGQQK